MAINFPNSPNLYQVYVDPVSKNSYVWTGDYWTGFTSTTSYQVGFNVASIVVEDDSSPVGVVSTLDFADNLDVVFSAGVATVTGAGGIATGFSTTASIDTTGIITASSFSGSGASLTGLTGASSGVYGDGEYVPQITVDSTGKIVGISTVAITVSGGGGGESYWSQTEVGIHTLSNVGIGTTNPTSALTVKGDTSLETLNVSGNLDVDGYAELDDLNVSGVSTFSDNVRIGADDKKLQIGAGNDIEIYHSSGVNYIEIDSGASLSIKDATNTRAVFQATGAVDLYYGANKKFETIGTGITVTGTTFTNELSASGVITASSFSGSGSGLTNLPSGQLTGALPAIDGSALLNITAVGSGIEIRDDEITVGTASTVDFGTGLDVTFSSGIATVAVASGFGTADVRTNTLTVSGVSTVYLNTSSPTQGGLDLVSGSNGKIRLSNDGGATTGSLRFLNGSNQQLATWQTDLTTGSIDIYNYTNFGTSNITLSPGGSVVLNYAGSSSKKFETLGAGVSVTGTTFTNQLSVSGVSTFQNDLNVNGDIYQNGVLLSSPGTLVGLGTFIAAVGVGHTIDSFVIATTDYKTVEYTLHVGFGSYIHAQKALIMQNGSNAYCQEYAIMGEPDILVSVNASVSSGICSIYVVPEVGVTGLVTYRYNRTALL
jgi:hypothetical protein